MGIRRWFAETFEKITAGLAERLRGNRNYKTSFQRIDEAKYIIRSAEEDYDKALDSLKRAIKNTEKAASLFCKSKIEIYQTTLKECLQQLQPVLGTHPEKALQSQPDYAFLQSKNISELLDVTKQCEQATAYIDDNGLSSPAQFDSHRELAISKVGGTLSGSLVMENAFNRVIPRLSPIIGFTPVLGVSTILTALNPFLLPASIFTFAFEQSKRIKKAKEYHSEAENFSLEMKLRIEEILQHKIKVITIRKKIKEAQRIIERLLELLSIQMEAVKLIKPRRFLWFKLKPRKEDCATAMIAYALITAIDNMCSTPIAGEDGTLLEQYDQLHGNIETLFPE